MWEDDILIFIYRDMLDDDNLWSEDSPRQAAIEEMVRNEHPIPGESLDEYIDRLLAASHQKTEDSNRRNREERPGAIPHMLTPGMDQHMKRVQDRDEGGKFMNARYMYDTQRLYDRFSEHRRGALERAMALKALGLRGELRKCFEVVVEESSDWQRWAYEILEDSPSDEQIAYLDQFSVQQLRRIYDKGILPIRAVIEEALSVRDGVDKGARIAEFQQTYRPDELTIAAGKHEDILLHFKAAKVLATRFSLDEMVRIYDQGDTPTRNLVINALNYHDDPRAGSLLAKITHKSDGDPRLGDMAYGIHVFRKDGEEYEFAA